MTKLEQLIEELCPNGVEYRTLGDIAIDVFRGAGIKRDEVTEEGIPYSSLPVTTNSMWWTSILMTDGQARTLTDRHFSE